MVLRKARHHAAAIVGLGLLILVPIFYVYMKEGISTRENVATGGGSTLVLTYHPAMNSRGDVYTISVTQGDPTVIEWILVEGAGHARNLTAGGKAISFGGSDTARLWGEGKIGKTTMVQTFNEQFLKMAGYSDEEIKKLGDLSQMSSEQMQEMVQKKTLAGLGLNGNGKQKIVAMTQVRDYVLQGWEFVNNLPNGEAIIRLPDSS